MKGKLIKIAYKMPPQENWNRFRDENQSNPNFITKEQYVKLVEAGFTHGMGLLEHGADIAERALSVADEVGLKYYVRDAVNWANILHPDYYYYNSENYLKHKSHKSFAGVYIFDEPNACQYPSLAKMVKGYYTFFKGIGEPLVNLLPTYASEVEQLGAKNYEEYICEYAKQVPTDYILFDHYPIRIEKKVREYLRDDFLYNCRVVATACKKYGKKYRSFVQSSIMDNGDIPMAVEAIGFQVHTHLAHGSTALVYYYYWGDEENTERAGIVDWYGNPTPLYYAIKKVHEEISLYESQLLDCEWEDTLYLKGSKEHHNKEEFARFDSCFLSQFKSEYDLVIGVFEKDGKKAYYLVNYLNPRLNLTNQVEIDLCRDMECWLGGEKLLLKKGKNRITLGCGGGAFIF